MVNTGEMGKSAVEGLKSQPAFFALVALVFGVLVMTHFAFENAETRRVHQFDEILARCNFQQYGGPHP